MDLSSLVIRLSADTATLQSDLGRAGSLSEQFSAKTVATWNAAGAAIGAGITAAVTGMSALVGKALENADNLSKLSQKVGMSTESLSALQYQAGLAGVSMETLESSIVKFSKNVTLAATGSKEQAAAFNAMGIALKDAQGNLRPTDQLLGELANKFAGYKDGAGKATLAQIAFGKTGADLIPLLNEGAKGMKDAAEEAAAYGRIVSGPAAEAAETFNDNVDRVKGAVEGFANQVMERMAPGLASMSEKLADGAKQGGSFSTIADGMATSLTWVVKAALVTKGAIEGLVNMIAASLDSLGGFKTMAQGAAENMMHSASGALKAAMGDFAGAREQFAQANASLTNGAKEGAAQISNAWSTAVDGIDTAIKRADSLAAALDKPKQAAGQFANVVAGVGPIIDQVEPNLDSLADKSSKLGKATHGVSDEMRQFQALMRESARAGEQLHAMAVRSTEDLQDMQARLSGADDAQIDFNHAIRDGLAALEQVSKLSPNYAQTIADYLKVVENAQEKLKLTRLDEQNKATFDAMNERLEDNKRRWESWADTIASNIMKGGNFLKNLLQSVKQIVAQIIQEWLKTRIVGLFMGGGGGSGFGSLVQAGLGKV
jgi:hypothetical protein